jgi:uncharacterized sulfatase
MWSQRESQEIEDMKKLIPLLIAICGLASADGKPNIVLLLADDMTWSDCEPYGSTNVPTPNILKLAEQGMRFDNMFTATAMCSPATRRRRRWQS